MPGTLGHPADDEACAADRTVFGDVSVVMIARGRGRAAVRA